MLRESHQLRLPHSNFWISANRYQPTGGASPTGVTLIFAHCTSGHKEQWEPVIVRLFELAAHSDASTSSPAEWRIREAWALDAPNHGDSAVLNKETLKIRPPYSVQDYASMLADFVRSPLVRGHDLVAIGHSASTSAWTIACSGSEALPLRALVLLEPVMVPPPILPNDPRLGKESNNVQGVLSRKEVWDDYQDLTIFLKKQFPWKIWDPRVMELYLKHGFVEVRDAETGKTKVMPKSLNAYEVAFYYADGYVLSGTMIPKMCARHPVHIMFGKRPDMISLKSREEFCDASQGRVMASVTVIPKCGHLAVQENPGGVAEAIFSALRGSSASGDSGKAHVARL